MYRRHRKAQRKTKIKQNFKKKFQEVLKDNGVVGGGRKLGPVEFGEGHSRWAGTRHPNMNLGHLVVVRSQLWLKSGVPWAR